MSACAFVLFAELGLLGLLAQLRIDPAVRTRATPAALSQSTPAAPTTPAALAALTPLNSPHKPASFVFKITSLSFWISGDGTSFTATLYGASSTTAFIVLGIEPIVMAGGVSGASGASGPSGVSSASGASSGVSRASGASRSSTERCGELASSDRHGVSSETRESE